jgi:hypothetical protein
MPQRRVNLDGQYYDYSDAHQRVEVPRTLLDISKAKRGKADKCMNSLACLRNKDLFPHAVIAVSTVKRRVYVIDKVYFRSKSGTAGHTWRYTLSAKNGNEIAEHDLLGVGKPATLILRPPTGTEKAGADRRRGRGSGDSNNRRHNAKNKGTFSRGETARLIAAVGAMRSTEGED